MRGRWVIFGGFGLIGAVLALLLLTTASNELERRAVEKTKRELRQQGFKVDLSEFNFSISPEMRVRARALTNAFWKSRTYQGNPRPMGPFPGFMIPVGTNSAAVIWKDDKPEDYLNPYELTQLRDKEYWTAARRELNDDQILLNDACAAALAGPIRFELNASAGFAMMLGHVAALKSLTHTLAVRAFLGLRDKSKDAAWTNLLALTRLVTAYEPEPADVSQLGRCACAVNAYNATWQVLQAGGWSDEQLSSLQKEWESADFLKGWPETAAFTRASTLDAYHRERKEPVRGNLSLPDILRTPRYAWSVLVSYRQRLKYRSHGTYEDEVASMLHYREREIELRRAVQASTWLAMRDLPVVTNLGAFLSRNASATQCLLNQRELSVAWSAQGQRPLGRLAEAEARRRVMITAIALERYRAQCGAYPKALEELVPKFLNQLLPDFMDGQPLRYLITSDGNFILYSVGLDCADNGGAMPTRRLAGDPNEDFVGLPYGNRPTDVVWPRPALPAEVETQKSEAKRAAEEEMKRAELVSAEWEKEMEAERRATVHKLLTIRQPSEPEPKYRGHPISEVLQKGKKGAKLTLEELLTLRQISTGEEPNIATYEVPMSYDAMSNVGGLHLVLDGGENHDCARATNGNCLLSWNTIFDPPGPHALQAEFAYADRGKEWNRITLRGPVTPYFSSNICQFNSLHSQYEESRGATLYAKLPESNGIYTIELKSPTGELVKTLTGSTSNGIIDVHWNLKDEHGKTYAGQSFDTVYHVTLPDSGRSQTMKGP